jgi:hypothetical protein
MVTGLAWLDDKNFVTIGVKHIKFWTLNGRNVTGKRGTGAGNNFIPLTAVTVAEGIAITGTAKGALCCWKGGSAGKVLNKNILAHSSP